jgi:hypothetical protein
MLFLCRKSPKFGDQESLLPFAAPAAGKLDSLRYMPPNASIRYPIAVKSPDKRHARA